MIVRQDASEATAWLGRLRDLRHDPASDHLLGVDIDDQRIVEFTTGGEFAGFFGRYGEGPGELRSIRAFELAGHNLVVLDSGNGKLVIFDRSTREMVAEVPLNRRVLDLTMLDDTLVAVMPGPEGALYERICVDGQTSGAFGDGGYLASSCSRCSITNIGEGLLAIVKPELPEGRIYRFDGTLFDAFGFSELDHVLNQWRLDFQETVRRMSGMAAPGSGGRMPAGRYWAGVNTGALGDGFFFASAVPENMTINPAEAWVLDRHGRVRERYVFDRPLIGISTVSSPRVFGLGLSHEFGVYEYRLRVGHD